MLFGLTNEIQQGLAILRARERVEVPRAVVVCDAASASKPGGALSFLSNWEQAGYEADVIDLAALRDAAKAPATIGATSVVPSEASPLTRGLKAMLFADVVGYSRIKEKDLAKFLTAYAELLHTLFATAGDAVKLANSWGDGLYVVFDGVVEAAAFATSLLNPARGWALPGLEADAALRVALHYGPVFELPDAIPNRMSYTGQHVNRAARIEPVTMPGCIYVSEQFAAVLTVTPGHAYRCEYLGQHELAKGYDRCGLYQLH